MVRATKAMRERARDMASPVHTHCAQHGTKLDGSRRCVDCRAAAVADLADDQQEVQV